MRVLLLSTYELGRQPFGLASPSAWLRAEGHEVTVADLARSPLPEEEVRCAGLIAFFLPMHTATRLFLRVVEKVRGGNPRAHLCAYGLYAPLNHRLLRACGIHTVIGGEFEEPLRELSRRLAAGLPPAASAPVVSLARQQFLVPDRTGLPALGTYARLLINGETRTVGYTEASRGCRHLCRHCPVVPVYQGHFRIVQPEIVLEDIRRQVAAGAQHITFGDPDFFNGPGHAVRLVEALHREWPLLTYDVTIKVEHLLQHQARLPLLQRTGCLFVTTAVESFDDAVLDRLAKGHTRAGFVKALSLATAAGLTLTPTFIPFTPWTTAESYRHFLREVAGLDLIEQVSPIQLAIRLLIPEGSLLLELPEIRGMLEPFDSRALCYPWRSPLDGLCSSIQELVKREERRHTARRQIFRRIWELVGQVSDLPTSIAEGTPQPARATIPYLTEPWYC